ncbi:MAG: DUF3626 domain-containing protein [Acidobacteria bacterium]|nr:DUF3626 domain-containing protein [Acidobacteriota bacterium]
MPSDTPNLERLTRAQRAALQHISGQVDVRRAAARRRLRDAATAAGCPESLVEAALTAIGLHARVVVHFHPDRIGARNVTTAEALLEDGRYRSQFETGLSSGGLTAFPGGDRDAWERSLFGGAYQAPGSDLGDRPRYGALELIRFPDGPWPRFGSCYLVLRPDVTRRTSFSFMGSEQPDAAERLGTIDAMEGVLAPLFDEIAAGRGAAVPWPPYVAPTLGVENLTIPSLLERISTELALPRAASSHSVAGRVLDTGIEAQVHGPIDMAHDVERVVADPSFAGTHTGDCLERLCRKHALPLDWHIGFRLAVKDVPDDFRGPIMPRLARRIARAGGLDAACIGDAQRSLRLQPEEWREWGTPAETLQYLKQLWHVLVYYGEPARPSERGM